MTRGGAGVAPLTARTEPWMERLLAEPDACAALIERHGSPLNLLDFSALTRNCGELVDVAREEGVELGVFVARKANKSFGLVSAARDAGHGVDVASLAELEQSLALGMPGERIIVTAAVKSRALLRTAVEHGATVSLDNLDELADLRDVASTLGRAPHVAARLASSSADIAPTRFGLTAAAWDVALSDTEVRLGGIHVHLNGYSALERVQVLRECLAWSDALRERGHAVGFIDIGGGVPMSYLDDEAQWRDFWTRLDGDHDGTLTWRGDRLGMTDPTADRPSAGVYPYWQPTVRGAWLRDILRSPAGDGETIAQAVSRRGLELRCEPGRSVLDGCGVTLASVAFRKATSDGVPLVGLHMNRTQVRSTSLDFMVDPRWVRPSTAGAPGEPTEAFLVGAYCVEEELILRRRLTFPDGVARGDIAAFINTGGYLMHILESASHQLPLAATLVRDGEEWVRDGIDSA